MGAAQEDLPRQQIPDLLEVPLAKATAHALPVVVRLTQDQGELHPGKAHCMQLAGGGNVGLAAALVHEVHIAQLPAQM
ncbi:hypothetical protein D3C75_1196780 [compost metagenome]